LDYFFGGHRVHNNTTVSWARLVIHNERTLLLLTVLMLHASGTAAVDIWHWTVNISVGLYLLLFPVVTRLHST